MAKLNLSNIGPMNNLLINGDFDIWQRGTSFNPVSADYTADRWKFGESTDAVCAVSRSSTYAGAGYSDKESDYSWKMVPTTPDTSIGATQFSELAYFFEGSEYANMKGKTLTLSFWARFYKPGTYSISIRPQAADSSLVKEFTIAASNVWQKVELTFPMTDTIGTYATGTSKAFSITFVFACGTTYQTSTLDVWQSGNYLASSNQENGLSSTSNTFFISQVKLEIGTVATPFISRPTTEEFILCQRYYQDHYVQSGLATVYNPSYIRGQQHKYPVEMRGAVTAVLSNVSWLPASGGSWGTIGTLYGSFAYADSMAPAWNTSGGTVGYCAQVTYAVTLDAELS